MIVKMIIVAILLAGCGSDYEEPSPTPSPSPTPGPGPQPQPVGFDVISPLLDQYCSQCHQGQGFMVSETAYRNSRSAELIFNRDMPRGSRLPKEVYDTFNRFR